MTASVPNGVEWKSVQVTAYTREKLADLCVNDRAELAQWLTNLVFYAQSTCTVVPGRRNSGGQRYKNVCFICIAENQQHRLFIICNNTHTHTHTHTHAQIIIFILYNLHPPPPSPPPPPRFALCLSSPSLFLSSWLQWGGGGGVEGGSPAPFVVPHRQ